jgi:branched-chain amino acid aminotransferase
MALAERKIWVDGALLPFERATVHLHSLSAQRGYMAFDVLSCHWLPAGPAVLGLRAHARRFLRSAELAAMRVALDLDGVCAAIGAAVRANPGAAIVKINAYYPEVSSELAPLAPQASVAVAAFAPADLPASLPTGRSLRLQLSKTRKQPADVLSPQAKLAGSYTYSAIAHAQARAEGFDDVLLLDQAGCLAELPTRSFFWSDGAALCTAPLDGVLEGVTRQLVIELARDEGVPVREERLPGERIGELREALVTGTTTGVRAVERIGESSLPPPVPGPLAQRLRARFERLASGQDAAFAARWLEHV